MKLRKDSLEAAALFAAEQAESVAIVNASNAKAALADAESQLATARENLERIRKLLNIKSNQCPAL